MASTVHTERQSLGELKCMSANGQSSISKTRPAQINSAQLSSIQIRSDQTREEKSCRKEMEHNWHRIPGYSERWNSLIERMMLFMCMSRSGFLSSESPAGCAVSI